MRMWTRFILPPSFCMDTREIHEFLHVENPCLCLQSISLRWNFMQFIFAIAKIKIFVGQKRPTLYFLSSGTRSNLKVQCSLGRKRGKWLIIGVSAVTGRHCSGTLTLYPENSFQGLRLRTETCPWQAVEVLILPCVVVEIGDKCRTKFRDSLGRFREAGAPQTQVWGWVRQHHCKVCRECWAVCVGELCWRKSHQIDFPFKYWLWNLNFYWWTGLYF